MTRRTGARRRTRNDEVAASTVLLLGGILMLAFASPAAGQPKTAETPVVHTAAANPHETFRTRVRADLDEWQQKMKRFDDRTAVSGQAHTSATENTLRTAWARTEIEGGKVERASSQDWEAVKTSYEAAQHDLLVAWGKVWP